MQQAKDGRIGKVTEFRRHVGIFGCLSFQFTSRGMDYHVHFDLPQQNEYTNVQYWTNRRGASVLRVVPGARRS